MKIGYPCINRSVGCQADKTFRLASYSEDKLIETIQNNLDCLRKILEYNVKNDFLFFRITSNLIPFGGHPINTFNWRKHFQKDFKEIGEYIKKNKIRISMHPDQFIVINSPNKEIVEKSVKDLDWHTDVLDLMRLGEDAKIQIHVGGVYGDKKSAIARFVENYKKLPEKIKKRLAIENDDKSYNLDECLKINKRTGIPIIFDIFHHKCLPTKENALEAIKKASKAWKEKDGLLMVDYSSQEEGAIKGKHCTHIDSEDFEEFLEQTKKQNFDVMLEIKDKEKSALEALRIKAKIR